MLVLTQGATFVKFATKTNAIASALGMGGHPVTRYVFYEKGEERGGMGALYWCKEGRRVRDPQRCIPLRTVTGLFEQAETAAFSGRAGAALSPSQRARCFSVVAHDRTLDLQASSLEQRDIWMHAIHQIMVHSGFGVHETSGSGATSPIPGGSPGAAAASASAANIIKSPTSASVAAREEANKLNALAALQVTSPGSQSSNYSSSPAAGLGSDTITINSSLNNNDNSCRNSTVSQSAMLSPPANALAPPQNSPLAAGSQATPANTPVRAVGEGGAPTASGNDTDVAAAADDPADADAKAKEAKLSQPLSPESASSAAGAPLRPSSSSSREVCATLHLPAAGKEGQCQLPVAVNVLSPSEHPTQTPACSPVS
jgi:hypothetical protein